MQSSCCFWWNDYEKRNANKIIKMVVKKKK